MYCEIQCFVESKFPLKTTDRRTKKCSVQISLFRTFIIFYHPQSLSDTVTPETIFTNLWLPLKHKHVNFPWTHFPLRRLNALWESNTGRLSNHIYMGRCISRTPFFIVKKKTTTTEQKKRLLNVYVKKYLSPSKFEWQAIPMHSMRLPFR